MQDPQELVFSGRLVEVGSLLIDKECIRNPDQLDVVSTNDKLLQARPLHKGQPWVGPELPEIHVQSEVLEEIVEIKLMQPICAYLVFDIFENESDTSERKMIKKVLKLMDLNCKSGGSALDIL